MANTNSFPDWLTNLNYPANGVGDLNDLQVQLAVGENGKWLSFINPGWYYYDGLERYSFVDVNTITHTATGLTGTITAPISFRPSWGPVLLSYGASAYFTQHQNNFYPATEVTWVAQGDNIFKATITSDAIVVGLRDLTVLPLGSVSGIDSIYNNKLYYYDQTNNEVYIKSNDVIPTVFVDLLYLNSKLRFRELVVFEPAGIRPTYKEAEQVTISFGYTTANLVSITTDYIDPTTYLGPIVGQGDLITLEYNIKRSYTLTDHKTIEYYRSFTSEPTNIVVESENSIPDTLPALKLDGTTFNFNPLDAGSYRAGYLFHSTLSQPVTSFIEPAKVVVTLDQQAVTKDWNEPFKLLVAVLDRNDIPCPWYPVTISTAPVVSSVGTYPALDTTDGRGEIHSLLYPQNTGVFSVSVTANSLTTIVTGSVLTLNQTIPASTFSGGQAYAIQTKKLTPRRYNRMFLGLSSLDGIPIYNQNRKLHFSSKYNTIFDYAGQQITKASMVTVTPTAENICGIVGLESTNQFGYLAQADDTMRVYSDGIAQSRIIQLND